MRMVIGALMGLIATAAYAVAAAELLGGETGVDLLAGLKPLLPDDVATWLARAPFASPEGAPMWRAPIMAVAVAAGAAGGLFLIAGSRLAAVSLWLAFLLLGGVLLGQDVAVSGDWFLLSDPAARPDLYARCGVLGAAFVFALIAHVVTGGTARPVEAAPLDLDLHEKAAHLRERPPPEPQPSATRQPAALERDEEHEPPPLRRRARSDAEEQTPARQAEAQSSPPSDASSDAARDREAEAPRRVREERRERDLDRTREAGGPEPEPAPAPEQRARVAPSSAEPSPSIESEREAASQDEENLEPAKG